MVVSMGITVGLKHKNWPNELNIEMIKMTAGRAGGFTCVNYIPIILTLNYYSI